METVIVRVTEQDVKQGKRWKCGSCPLALALRRTLGYAVKVAVDSNVILIKHLNTYWICNNTTTLIRNFIYRFDKGYEVSYILKLPIELEFNSLGADLPVGYHMLARFLK